MARQLEYWTDTIWRKRGFKLGLLAIGLLVVFGIIAVAVIGFSSPLELDTQFSILDGVQLKIDNREAFDWTAVHLTLNNDYALYCSRIEAETIYTVGLGQFAKDDGTRFNPFTTKPMKIAMSCDIPDGEGVHTAYWN